MTRSIPSILVLTLMSFTISYGLVRFPEAGILDNSGSVAAQSPTLAADQDSAPAQKVVAWKPTENGEAPAVNQSEEPSVLSQPQVETESLFIPQTPAPITDEFSAPQTEPQESNATHSAPSEDGNAEAADPFAASDNQNAGDQETNQTVNAENNETTNTEQAQDESTSAQTDSSSDDVAGNSQLDQIKSNVIPPVDNCVQEERMPIKIDEPPMPEVDSIDPDLPLIVVGEGDTQVPAIDDGMEAPAPIVEPEQTTDEYWDKVLNSDPPAQNADSKEPKTTASDSTSQDESVQGGTLNTLTPSPIISDPNAREIPPSIRQKPGNANSEISQPTYEKSERKSSNPSDTDTLPIETFSLETQQVSYTVQENVQHTDVSQPVDSLGFDIPPTGPIVTRRLPSIQNAIDPIYNNVQMNRFAL